jgi:hypothetical protein
MVAATAIAADGIGRSKHRGGSQPKVVVAVPAKRAGSKAQRRMERRARRRERWLALFRPKDWQPAMESTGKGGLAPKRPKATKREVKRAYIREAQLINPAIRTFGGARKLDRRLTREASAARG